LQILYFVNAFASAANIFFTQYYSIPGAAILAFVVTVIIMPMTKMVRVFVP